MKLAATAAVIAFVVLLVSESVPAHAQTGTVTGVVWHDANANGVRDPNEEGLPGWTVYLMSRHFGSAITGKTGTYEISLAEPKEDIFVCLTLNDGWIATGSEPPPQDDTNYCRDAVQARVSVPSNGATTASFGVVPSDASLRQTLSCPAVVVVDLPFECTLSIENDGNTAFADVTLGANRSLCFGQVCVASPNVFSYLSSTPPWTTRRPQSGDPTWLGLGDLAPASWSTVRLQLQANDVDPEHANGLCVTGSGIPQIGDFIPPFPVLASAPFEERCRYIDIVGGAGDANCDQGTDVIDAALILQHVAGLLAILECAASADANGDGLITPVDATLILQLVAGLLSYLPP